MCRLLITTFLFYVNTFAFSLDSFVTKGDYGLLVQNESLYLNLGIPEVWIYSDIGIGVNFDPYSLNIPFYEDNYIIHDLCETTLFFSPNLFFENGVMVGPEISFESCFSDNSFDFCTKIGFYFNWIYLSNQNQFSIPIATRIISLRGEYDPKNKVFCASFSLDISMLYYTSVEILKNNMTKY